MAGKLVANALVTPDVKDSPGDRTCDNAASGGYGAEQSIKISWSEKEVSVN